jgi:hypothetical protein
MPGTVGVNFGAPGNRRGPEGVLWLDVPSVGGEKDTAGVTIVGASGTVRHHASRIEAGELRWVAASALEGAVTITVPLPSGTYDLDLVFAELGGRAPDQCVFDVIIGRRTVIRALDVVRAAGGVNRSVVRTLRRRRVRHELSLRLSPRTGVPQICGMRVRRR